MVRDLPDDLDLLLALDVLLRERHVTRAAKRLGVTQSAASQQLARLREYFGDLLLAPGRPLMALTPRAQALADPLAAALAGLRAALRIGAPFDRTSSERRFVLLGDDMVEALALPLLLPPLCKTAPRVSLHCERIDADFAQRLERGAADLAFVPEFAAVPSLRRLALPDAPFVTLMRAGHPEARRRLGLDAYLELGHVLIAPRGLPGSLVDRALAALGRTRRVVVQIQHFVSAPFVIAASDLVVTCPATLLAIAAPFQLHVAQPPVELALDRTCAVWHERVHDDPGHRWLRSLLEAAVRAQQQRRRAPHGRAPSGRARA
jgi:DNA-binding transcriptional LysR family regulator